MESTLFPFQSLSVSRRAVGLFALDGCTGDLDLAVINGTGSTATSQKTTQVAGPTGEYADATSFAAADASISVLASVHMDTKYAFSVLLHAKLDGTGVLFTYPEGGINLRFDGTNLVFTVRERNGVSEATVQGAATVGSWHYIAAIVDYNFNTVSLSIDGEATLSSFDIPQTEIDTRGNVVIGADGFNGELSCVQFYDFVLLPDEIESLVECPAGVGIGNDGKRP